MKKPNELEKLSARRALVAPLLVFFGLIALMYDATYAQERNASASQASGIASYARPGDIKEVELCGVTIAFRWIPAGSFKMGSPEDETIRYDNETQHAVTIQQGFWLAETETTQKLWKAVMGENPSANKGDDLPVERVSWNDCVAFIAKANKQCAQEKYLFALPTEEEWEYACRAGTRTPFSFGESLNGDKANCNGLYAYGGAKKEGPWLQKTTPAGVYPSNAWGLFDMHGNVWEWCESFYAEYGETPNSDDKEHVVRGGSWSSRATNCRAAYRGRLGDDEREFDVGFRLKLIEK